MLLVRDVFARNTLLRLYTTDSQFHNLRLLECTNNTGTSANVTIWLAIRLGNGAPLLAGMA